MECPRCRAALPEVAQFCHACGADQRHPDAARRKSFAVKPDEPVASFALVSSIMPRGAAEHPRRYAWAMFAVMAVALVAAIFGAVPIAVMVAAFAIPLVYVVYLYDVNLWEDEPLPVTLLAFVVTFVLGVLFTWGWSSLVGHANQSLAEGVAAGPTVPGLLVVALLVPLVGEIIREVGPIILARMPHFDDLMDGLTFGVIAGVAYAAAETVVLHWGNILTGFTGPQDGSTNFAILLFLDGFIKPLIYGTATGIACAEFSGLGKRYDGFTTRYFLAFGQAVLAVALYQAGTYLLRFLQPAPLSLLLQLVWGAVILAVLILRIRTVLHTGLMEAALESAARTTGEDPGDALEFCGRCEMPLVPGSGFCSNCGTATRTRTKPTHEHRATPAPVAAAVAAPATAPASTPERVAPQPAAGATVAERPVGQPSDQYFDDEEGRA